MPPSDVTIQTLRASNPVYGSKRTVIKNYFVAMTGEYVGTTLFILCCLGGVQVAKLPETSVTGNLDEPLNTSSLFYISASFGFALAVNVWIFFRVSGGLFNPAVSLGMVLAGCLSPMKGALLTVAQLLGGITGAAIIDALVPGQLNAGTALGAGTSIVQGLFIEVFLTALLMLTIFFMAAEKHQASFIAPLAIGLALFMAEMVGVVYTGGSLNPARSLGPAVVTHNFPGYHWIYWVGPGLGAILAAGFYSLLKFLEYESVPGPEEAPHVTPLFLWPSRGSRSMSTHFRTYSHEVDPEKGLRLHTTPQGNAEPVAKVHEPGSGDKEVHRSVENSIMVNARLDRIEMLLTQLVQMGPSDSTQTAPAA
ncbi:aquaporin rerated protein, other eukaryote [Cryptococcus deuterogattii 99/473]|uniref:Aquaporin rerated protein, other eukaryote n=2 Tax=Cryptococcus deuterogattii TaxID=1859096 RepID=A0A0D0V855_9TREE|nr:aquaporin rerated protein other eukaryote [Cryptococcus deuterogattii R265]KIR24900.1 aquaporin rerated protein, other eukaryote [Cryptococcus deuterogattii LA55]KIR37147.1 aquaporin rerated protein, other eukaryote [Cryptococcus deuterogattii MMRL2647]KIR43616.1 aquaporin rerated protein, other eukaryote [Cryptococcus deuterogattii Ram5]KIR74950.1 aquaporin rerated protein, other eukaryote [Cryptococcus deuterogattii CA1014]KIR92619.1 aquaporin rerated protein, other eukaryote [Cryptococcu